MIANKTRSNILLPKNQKYCHKELKCCKFMWKRNKAKHLMKNDHSKW